MKYNNAKSWEDIRDGNKIGGLRAAWGVGSIAQCCGAC